jgi:hypothetical protein
MQGKRCNRRVDQKLADASYDLMDCMLCTCNNVRSRKVQEEDGAVCRREKEEKRALIEQQLLKLRPSPPKPSSRQPQAGRLALKSRCTLAHYVSAKPGSEQQPKFVPTTMSIFTSTLQFCSFRGDSFPTLNELNCQRYTMQ